MRPIPVLAAAMAISALMSAPVLAAGSDSTSTPTCPQGKVYSQTKKMCVDAESRLLDDKSLTNYAYALAKEGRYEEALQTLDRLQNPNTPVALNYRGYATRKLGRVDEGIGYYLKSVALDPEYTLVREYLGEAYVIQGRLDLAKQQLAEIEKRCGTTCEPYGELAEFISAANT
jgi:tetratricopeptide (TPR) repeat protein